MTGPSKAIEENINITKLVSSLTKLNVGKEDLGTTNVFFCKVSPRPDPTLAIFRPEAVSIWHENISQVLTSDLVVGVEQHDIATRGIVFSGEGNGIDRLVQEFSEHGADRNTSIFSISPSGEPFVVSTEALAGILTTLSYAYPRKPGQFGLITLYNNLDRAIRRCAFDSGVGGLRAVDEEELERTNCSYRDQWPSVIVQDGMMDTNGKGWKERIKGFVLLYSEESLQDTKRRGFQRILRHFRKDNK